MGHLYHGIYKWASFHGYVKLPEGNIFFTNRLLVGDHYR